MYTYLLLCSWLTLDREMEALNMIDRFAHDSRHNDAISVSQQLIDLALKGLSYYHHYDRFFLG